MCVFVFLLVCLCVRLCGAQHSVLSPSNERRGELGEQSLLQLLIFSFDSPAVILTPLFRPPLGGNAVEGVREGGHFLHGISLLIPTTPVPAVHLYSSVRHDCARLPL